MVCGCTLVLVLVIQEKTEQLDPEEDVVGWRCAQQPRGVPDPEVPEQVLLHVLWTRPGSIPLLWVLNDVPKGVYRRFDLNHDYLRIPLPVLNDYNPRSSKHAHSHIVQTLVELTDNEHQQILSFFIHNVQLCRRLLPRQIWRGEDLLVGRPLPSPNDAWAVVCVLLSPAQTIFLGIVIIYHLKSPQNFQDDHFAQSRHEQVP
jgi:hypothetical protein